MILSELILQTNPDTIALIGSGGKTTLMRTLARENRKDKRVLLSNTINMERIPEEEMDFIDYEYRQDYSLCADSPLGVHLLAYEIESDNTLRGLSLEVLESQIPCFDLSIVECDESRQRPIKAWRRNEPVLPFSTDITLGILDITALGLTISVETVHNLDVYCDFTGKKVGDIITREDIKRLILDPNQMFRAAIGERILFINKVENSILEEYATILAREIARSSNTPDTIIIGSLREERYTVIRSR